MYIFEIFKNYVSQVHFSIYLLNIYIRLLTNVPSRLLWIVSWSSGFSESSALTICLLHDAINIPKLHNITRKKTVIHPGMELRLSCTI